MHDFMLLDLYTMRLMNVLIGVVLTIALSVSLRNRYVCPGIRFWFCAMLFFTIGSFFILIKNAFPIWVGILGGYGSLILAYVYLWLGFRLYTKTFVQHDYFAVLLAPITVATVFWLYETGTPFREQLQVVLFVLAFFAGMSFILALKQRKPSESGRLLCAWILAIVVGTLVTRGITIQSQEIYPSASGPDFSYIVLMLIWSLSLLGLGSSILLITAQWLQQRLFIDASYDPLTGIFNRHALSELTETLSLTSDQTTQTWSLAMIDIDHFKIVNDNYGHPIGDDVLKWVAMTLKQSVRHKDILARYGGEEFVVVLPDTSLAQACIWAERVRETIAKTPFQSEKHIIDITVSIGLASMNNTKDNLDEIIKHADVALYDAKNSGRNKISYTGK